MQESGSFLKRRSFLKLSGGAMAAYAVAGGPTLATGQTAAPGPRSAPPKPVVLRSQSLEVMLDGRDALPYEFHLLSSRTRITGEHAGKPILASICEKASGNVTQVELGVAAASAAKTQQNFAFEAA